MQLQHIFGYVPLPPAPATLGLFDIPPSRRAEGIPSPKSEYPGEARPGTLPNSYFTTRIGRGFSRPCVLRTDHIPSTKRYSIRSRRFPIEHSSASLEKERNKRRESDSLLSQPSRRRHTVRPPPVFAKGFTMFAVHVEPYCYL